MGRSNLVVIQIDAIELDADKGPAEVVGGFGGAAGPYLWASRVDAEASCEASASQATIGCRKGCVDISGIQDRITHEMSQLVTDYQGDLQQTVRLTERVWCIDFSTSAIHLLRTAKLK